MNNSIVQAVTQFDQRIVESMHLLHNPVLTNLLIFITNLGDPKSLIAISGAILLMFWLVNKKLHAVQFTLSMLVGSGAVVVLKHVFIRSRPIGGLIVETGYSFPSGHALVAAVFFPVLVYILKRYIKSPALRFSFIVCMYGAMLLVGFSRLYLGVHYTSDVIAGLIVGIIISCVSIMATEAYVNKAVKDGTVLE